jgi:hypothetical protein
MLKLIIKEEQKCFGGLSKMREGFKHHVNSVPGLLSSSPNWPPPAPSPASECCRLPLVPKGGDTLACGKGGGGSQFGRRDSTLVL